MKNNIFKYTIAILFLIVSFNIACAQAPDKMSYQAVVRNASSELVSSTTIVMKISVLKTSPAGTVVYSETQTPTTNVNGLVSIEIGTGTTTIGTFSQINWADGPYFIKTETDPTGGSNFSLIAISQMLSVPYALHAKTAESATETDPLFSSSPVSTVTTGQITSWDNKQDKLIAGSGIAITGNTISASGGGKTYIYISGDITDTEAADKLAAEFGPNTQHVSIIGTTALTNIDLSVFGTYTLGSLLVSQNEVLTNINLSGLKKVESQLNITDNLVLNSVSFPSLINAYGSTVLSGMGNNNGLAISLPNLKKADNITALNCSSTLDLPLLEKVNSIDINSCPLLTTASFPALIRATNFIQIQSTENLTSIDFSTLQNSRYITIVGIGALTSLSFPALENSGDITINSSTSLSSLLFPVLENSTSINLNGLPSLNTIEFPSLENALDLNLSQLMGLNTIALPSLTNARQVSIEYCSNTSLDFSALQITAGINMHYNGSLTQINFPALTESGNINISDCSSVTSVNFNSLSIAKSGVQIYNMTGITSIALPSLSLVTNFHFDFFGNPNLFSLNFPVVSNVVSNYLNFDASNCALPTSNINTILQNLNSISTVPTTGGSVNLSGQTPAAPPSGAGITAQNGLVANGINVITD